MKPALKIGTRGSRLARMQSDIVARLINRHHPDLNVEIVPITTTGDLIQDRPLHEFGGKGLFVREIELALLDGTIDLAVHSYKDVPITMPLVDQAGLTIACVPEREDPSDVVIFPDRSIQTLLPGSRVGTSSLRRRCQLLEIEPSLRIIDVRGNIDTRLKKLQADEFDALILARAGLIRAGLFDPGFMKPVAILPAAGQGALALQCRSVDQRVIELLRPLDDPLTNLCVQVERDVIRRLHGDCQSPIAALATIAGDQMHLRIAVGQSGGELPVHRAETQGPIAAWRDLAGEVCSRLPAGA